MRYADLAYNGYWFSPEMEYTMEALRAAQRRVTGTVRVHLCRGNVAVRGRRSPYSLYDERLSSMVEAGGYDPVNAEGFIKVWRCLHGGAWGAHLSCLQINAIRLKAHHRVSAKVAGKKQ